MAKKRKLKAAEMPNAAVSIDPPKRARPTNFSEALQKTIMQLAEDGFTDVQIATRIGVCEKTFYIWKNKYPELRTSLGEAKDIPDDLVEATLFQKAIGYKHEAVKIFFDPKSMQTVEHKYIEHYPPDTTAAIFWLKNRRPESWRDKIELKHEDVASMTDDELVDIIREVATELINEKAKK
jgi:hypothetical protein